MLVNPTYKEDVIEYCLEHHEFDPRDYMIDGKITSWVCSPYMFQEKLYEFPSLGADDMYSETYDSEKVWQALYCDAWFQSYGVCDYPEQLFEKYPYLINSNRKFFVCFTHMSKKSGDDFRWHKNGPYIGKGETKCEHFMHEPIIEEVYLYHINEILENK